MTHLQRFRGLALLAALAGGLAAGGGPRATAQTAAGPSAAAKDGAAPGAATPEGVKFPVGSRIGLAPMPGLAASPAFPGFGDAEHNVFIRIVALPEKAYGEIEKTMTNDALKQQGVIVARRETLVLPGGKALLVVAEQTSKSEQLHKWLLIAPVGDLTALVSVEVPDGAEKLYPDAAIRAALTSLTARATVPTEEELTLVPFRVGDLAGFRIARVLPGIAVQLTDGPKDTFDAVNQPHLVISAASGGPEQPRDRDRFARDAMSGLPPFKELRIVGSEPMRIGGQQGYELRAEAKDPATGTEVTIVQWLRFGTGAYLRIVGFAPRERWSEAFNRFRAVRDGVDSR
jgi:hypothetical protein